MNRRDHWVTPTTTIRWVGRRREKCDKPVMVASPSITIQVPREFRANGNGTATLSVLAGTVREALSELHRQYPTLHRGVCDETGRLRRHINLFVNSTHMRDRNELETVLNAGDVITILPAVSGG